MSSFKKFLYYFIYPACLIFTLFSLVFYIASGKFSSDSGTVSYAYMMLAAIAYAFILSLISLVLRTKKSIIARVIIHYLLILATIIVILIIAGDTFQFSSDLWIVGIITLVYAIIAVPSVIVYMRKAKAEEDSKEYKKAFSGKK